MENKTIKEKLMQYYKVYFKDSYDYFPHWKKDNFLSGMSLENILKYFEGLQKAEKLGEPYEELKEIKKKRKGLIYKFEVKTNIEKGSLGKSPTHYNYYKIIPELRLLK